MSLCDAFRSFSNTLNGADILVNALGQMLGLLRPFREQERLVRSPIDASNRTLLRCPILQNPMLSTK